MKTNGIRLTVKNLSQMKMMFRWMEMMMKTAKTVAVVVAVEMNNLTYLVIVKRY